MRPIRTTHTGHTHRRSAGSANPGLNTRASGALKRRRSAGFLPMTLAAAR
jgi:hypothetical protein